MRSYGLREHRRHSEAGSASDDVIRIKREQLQPIIAQFALKDCYNCDEAALFKDSPPDKGLSSQRMPGKKVSKDQITLFFICNKDGSDKQPILFIGKAKTPRCFKSRSALACGYYY